MPLPLIPLITAGSMLASQGINAAATGSMNRKTRKWNEKMYAQQRADSLADFALQNDYNSPTSQMKRLREAGLNPALVYENGATHTAGAVRSSSVESWKPEAPQFDLGSAVTGGLAAHYDTQIKQAQTDNLKAQNSVLLQDAVLRAAQVQATLAGTGLTNANTDTAKFDLMMKNHLKEISFEAAKAGLNKTLAETTSILSENERRQALQATTMQQAIENILSSRAQRANTMAEKQRIIQAIEGIKRDNKIKDYEIELNRQGVQRGDKLWERKIAEIIDNLPSLNKMGSKIVEGVLDWPLSPIPKK